jgi:hypothetical protein
MGGTPKHFKTIGKDARPPPLKAMESFMASAIDTPSHEMGAAPTCYLLYNLRKEDGG